MCPPNAVERDDNDRIKPVESSLETGESNLQEVAVNTSKDSANPASRNWQGEWPKTPGRLFGVSLIRLYQLTLSGFIGNSCRHQPTCSEYGYEAIARHGLWRGGWLTAWRVARCNPLGKAGYDPVPKK